MLNVLERNIWGLIIDPWSLFSPQFNTYKFYDSYTCSLGGLWKYFYVSESLGIQIKLEYHLYKSKAVNEITSVKGQDYVGYR